MLIHLLRVSSYLIYLMWLTCKPQVSLVNDIMSWIVHRMRSCDHVEHATL